MTLFLMSMLSNLFIILKLLLESLRLRTYWIIMFMVGEGPLSMSFLSSDVAIYCRRPLGNLGSTWLMHPTFWLCIWNIKDYTPSQGGVMLSFGFILLVMCFFIGLYMRLFGCISMCILFILYCCKSHMTAILQPAAPIGWHPNTLWYHQRYK